MRTSDRIDIERMDSVSIPVLATSDIKSSKNGSVSNGECKYQSAPRGYCAPSYRSCLVCQRFPVCYTLASWISALSIICILLVALLVGRDYIKQCLLWLDHQEEWLVCAVFLFLYTAVSFPMTWGYVVLNLACGYHFGLLLGLFVTAVAASVGIAFAHLLMKHYFIHIISSKVLKMNVLRSTLAALESSHAFKLIAISRLTPIPFGLQNAVFAISPICIWRYVGASALGLFPTQVIGVYLGSTVRSMEEVLVDEGTATVGYIVLFVQVILSILLFMYILRRARDELNKTLGKDLNGTTAKNGFTCTKNGSGLTINRFPHRWSRHGPGSYLLHQI